MKTDLLLFKDIFETKTSYNEIANSLKFRIGKNCALGYIEREEFNVYYFNNWYTNNIGGGVPTCNIYAKNPNTNDGPVKIEFKIANYFLIISFLIPLIIVSIFYFSTDELVILPFFAYPVIYILLINYLKQQSNRFKIDLRLK